MIDRKTFFDRVRAHPFDGFLSGSQVTGLSNILDEAERRKDDPRFLAYRLATVFHESAKTMQPIKEAGGETYLRSKPYYPAYGRGLVQCTWDYNYSKFGCKNYDDMLQWPMALKALFDGMDQGVFTGRKLATYFNDKIDDPTGARHIINGSDKAALIATYHAAFLAAIKAAMAAAPALGLHVDTDKPVLASIETAINAAAKKQGAVAGVVVPKVMSPSPLAIPPIKPGPDPAIKLPAVPIDPHNPAADTRPLWKRLFNIA